MTRKPCWRAQSYLRDRARQLRHTPKHAEALLWQQLRNRGALGLKWRRQHPVGRFIADFYCAEYSLIVELDGPIHRYQTERDAARDARLMEAGYRVLRIDNEDVERDIERVIARITQACTS